jgi:putative spermidine/putrescine transport system substrate-binding protein
MNRPRTTIRAVVAAMGAAVLAVGGLGGCSSGKKPLVTVRYAHTIGPGEGQLNLVAFPGYVQSGTNDPKVDWVTPFTNRTGCKVNLKAVTSPQQMVALMSDSKRRYDGVSAPPETAGQLIAARQVAQLNPALVDAYPDLQPRLRALTRKGGKVYGVPFAWGADLIMYDTRAVQPAPSGWSALFDPAKFGPYAGKIVMRDSPLDLADAALYLKSTDHKLGITNPYELTARQLAAAAAVLKKQHPAVQAYWGRSTDAIEAFAGNGAVLGQVGAYHVDVLGRAGLSVQSVRPSEGVTGWSDAWMMSARASHPNCMYQWMSWTNTPDVQQQLAQWNGVAAANPALCSQQNRAFCDAYHIDDKSYLDRVQFAAAPVANCGNGNTNCTDYSQWVRAWNKLFK